MALERKDRVKDQSSTTGTGTLTVDLVAPPGYRTMATHTTGVTVNYLIIDATGTNWEVGQGVWTTTAQTLTRATVFASSNAGALVSFGVGIKAVATLPTVSDFDLKADLASPAFTGNPTAPIQAAGDNSTRLATTAFVAAAVSTAVPAGVMVWIPATTAIAGTVKLNGSLLNRVTFARLWAFAQASGNLATSDAAWTSGQFSPGDGSTTFRIPDYRGYQVRSFDDARGIDTGRTIGSVQADQLLAHNHGISDPSHSHGISDPGHIHGVSDPGHVHTITHDAFSDTSGDGISGSGRANGGTWQDNGAFTGIAIANNGSNLSLFGAGTGITINNSIGGAEVRVKNIAALACIYF